MGRRGEIKAHFATLFSFIVPNVEIFGVVDHVADGGSGNPLVISHVGGGIYAHELAFDVVLHDIFVLGHGTNGGFAGLDGTREFGGFTHGFGGGLGGGGARFSTAGEESCGCKNDRERR